jgi:hypothetical protein
MDYNILGERTRANGGVIGVILVVILLAILVNVKPNYFKYLFKSFLGNLILAFVIIVIGIMDIKWGIGFAAIAFIIYQAFQISCVQVEGFEPTSSTCKPGCAAPTKPNGNCTVSLDKKTLSCPWECSTDPSNYKFDKYGHGSANCVYNSDCASCAAPVTFNNPAETSNACFDSQFGCCSDGNTTKVDSAGSNCPTSKQPVAACFSSKYGCCPDGITASVDTAGSNCSASGSSGNNPWDNKDVFSKNSWSKNLWYKNKRTDSKPDTGITSSTTSKSLWGLFPEGYPIPKNTIWPQKVIDDFVAFQKVHNPNLRFDLDVIQRQATAEEAETLLKTGKWPWTPDVITLYKNAIAQNNIINSEPGSSLLTVQSVYNQTAIVELLSWNTKEGSFLLNGAIIKHTDGMPDDVNNLVRCGKDKETGKISMQKVVYTGYNGINGSIVSRITPIANADIPKEVNGFKFLKSECNPCSALDDPADYSCPFSLDVGNGPEVSSVWKQLWGLNSSGSTTPGATKTDALSPGTTSTEIPFNKDDFPILSQLGEELMKGVSYMKITFEKPSAAMSNTPGSEDVSAITGSSVPAIVTNGSREHKIYYGTKNMSSGQ